MRARDGITYAIIENDVVSQFFDSTQLREWDENTLYAVEVPINKDIRIGTAYDKNIGAFIDPTLDELKDELINEISFYFEREVMYLQGQVSQNELATYEMQKQEAKAYLQDNSTATPLLSEIAKKRGYSVATLAAKVIAKNEIYLKKLGMLLGYKQSLVKRVQSCEDKGQLENIKYISPLNEEA